MNDIDLTKLLQKANDCVPRLKFDESVAMMSSQKNLIIDVREEIEVSASGLIQGAINIPKSIFDQSFSNELIDQYIDDRDNINIFLYCAVGVRSALVGLTLVNNGYSSVFNIGGFTDWIENKGPLNR